MIPFFPTFPDFPRFPLQIHETIHALGEIYTFLITVRNRKCLLFVIVLTSLFCSAGLLYRSRLGKMHAAFVALHQKLAAVGSYSSCAIRVEQSLLCTSLLPHISVFRNPCFGRIVLQTRLHMHLLPPWFAIVVLQSRLAIIAL